MKNARKKAGIAGLEAHSTDLEAHSIWALMRKKAGGPTNGVGAPARPTLSAATKRMRIG